MSVMDMNSRMAMAEKLSVQQLQQAVQSGSLPAYIGIPLIEQKTKERAQMAAAQQGQQKPPSVAASILQQADEQEQQERGIDELPSNLPTEQDEEMGMAGGGIIAFADRGQVEDQMLRDSYNPPRPSRGRYDIPGPIGNLREYLSRTSSPPDYSDPLSQISGLTPESMADDQARIDALPAQEQAAEKARVAKMLKQMEVERQQIIRQRQTEATQRLGFLNQSAPDTAARFAQENQSVLNPQSAQPQTQSFPNEFPEEGASPSAGITAAPGAKLAPEGTPGAPRTAPAGSTSPTRGAAPPSTLAAAEKSDSPAANQATSMLDKYVAMLEKSGEDVGRQKKEALYMALIQGGLGMMGGTSPNAFANIAAGLLPATQAYQQAIAGIRKDDRARVEKLINAGLSKEKFAMELRKLGIEEKRVDALVNFYNAKAGAAGGSGSGDDNKKNIAYNTATAGYQREVGKVDGLIAKIKQDNGMYLDYTGKDKNMLAKKQRLLADISELNKKKDNMYSQYRSYVTDRLGIDTPDFSGASGGGNAPAVGTVKDGYKFKGGNPGDPKSWEKV